MNNIRRISVQCWGLPKVSVFGAITRPMTRQLGLQPIKPRHQSFATQTNRPSRSIRIPPLPVALTVFGFGCLSMGLYQYFWSDIQKYPVPVRQALRKALYYENYGNDPSLAIDYYKQALEIALESEKLENNSPHVTGIMIQYGTLLETEGKPKEARYVLTTCLGYLLDISPVDVLDKVSGIDLSSTSLSDTDRTKVLGIAQKLGDLSVELKDDGSAEKWFSWSVEQMFKSTLPKVSGSGMELEPKEKLFNAENMPKWLTKNDVGAAMEALAAFYAEKGKYQFALPLYLRVLGLYPDLQQSCHASVLMCNVAEVFAGMGQYQEAIKWAEDGIEIAKNPNTGTKKGDDRKICDEALGVLLYNIGMVYEV
jgi:tetratricopeptide (TPR) repeat protein